MSREIMSVCLCVKSGEFSAAVLPTINFLNQVCLDLLAPHSAVLSD